MIYLTTLHDDSKAAIGDALHPLSQFEGLNTYDISPQRFEELTEKALMALFSIWRDTDILQHITSMQMPFTRSSGLVLKNLPIDPDTFPVPSAIREETPLSIGHPIMVSLMAQFGPIASCGFQNSIRFPFNDRANTEPWHSHIEYQYTALYCHQGDPQAAVLWIDANDIMQISEQDDPSLGQLFLTPFSYIDGESDFSLIVKKEHGYIFAPQLQRDQSALGTSVEGLDLPDTADTLEGMISLDDPEHPKNRALFWMRQIILMSQVMAENSIAKAIYFDHRNEGRRRRIPGVETNDT